MTVIEALKNGYCIAAGPVTPTLNSVMVGNGTAFVVTPLSSITLTGTTQSSTPFLTVLGVTNLNSATGVDNTGIGYQAGNAMTTGTDGTFVGFQAGLVNTAVGNTFVGSQAGRANTSTTGHVHVGYQAGRLVTGADNTIIGYQAGDAFTTGTANVLVGKDSGGAAAATAMSSNTFVGYQTGLVNTGDGNTFIGYQAGVSNISSTGQVLIGYQAGGATTGSNNTIIGYQAGIVQNTGSSNVFIGYQSGFRNQTGIANVFIGDRANGNSSAGSATSNNVAIGPLAGWNNTADDCVFIGNRAGAINQTSGTGLVYVGSGAGKNTSGSDNTIVGKDAGDGFTTGARNSLFGKDAGGAAGATAMSDCTFLGYQAGLVNTANQNEFIGSGAGALTTSGARNSAVGYQSLNQNQTATDNVCLGNFAGYYIRGAQNVAIGSGVMSSGSAVAVTDNVLIGYLAGNVINNVGAINNVVVGSSAAGALSSGAANIIIGKSSGSVLTTGSNNIFIGTGSQAESTGTANTCVIGGATSAITNVYFNKGITSTTATAYTINGTGGSGSNNAGADILLAGGLGTGTAANGYVGTKYGLLTTTGSTLHTKSALTSYYNGYIYVSTADATLTANSSTTGTLIGAQTGARPQGTLTLDANLLDVGSTIRIKGYGQWSVVNSGTNLKIDIKLGSTVVATTGAVITDAAGATSKAFMFDVVLICRSTGATGTIQGDGSVFASRGGLSNQFSFYQAATTVDTTASQAIDVFGTWSSNTAGCSVTISNLTVEYR